MSDLKGKLKNLERLVIKIESLDPANPYYYTLLYTNLMVLATVRKNKAKLEELRKLYEEPAKLIDGEEQFALCLSALQTHGNYLKGKTMRGGLKVEPILIDLDIKMKLIYYDLIEDLDIDIIKKGVNLRNVNVL